METISRKMVNKVQRCRNHNNDDNSKRRADVILMMILMITLSIISGTGRHTPTTLLMVECFSVSSFSSSSLKPSSSSSPSVHFSLLFSSTAANNNKETAELTTAATNAKTESLQLRRELGSQENLMLPRQYGVNKDVEFPSMNHVSVAVLNKVPSENALNLAIDECMTAHPLLRSKILGSGEPDERIDLFKMVRKGDNDPLTFVAANNNESTSFTAKDVLKIIDVDDVEKSWKRSFLNDLDDGSSWCDVKGGTTPLWKLELHRNKNEAAMLLSFNHAISDQSSASRLTDQLLTLVSEYEEQEEETKRKKPKLQSIPPSVEESVLGINRRFKDVGTDDTTVKTIKYVAGKALEETKAPVILPDDFKNAEGGGLMGALTTISGNAAGGDDEDSTKRKSVIAFRTLSKESTSKLLQKCRQNNVSITNALSAALTLTSSDYVGDNDDEKQSRNYKILQSLDMRRFGQCLDEGKSVGCLAGSMDLMHGRIEDNSGSKPRKSLFWELAKEGKEQTNAFINEKNPEEAVRVFDFAMTISDMNNLVHLTAQSKDSQGRAYSAGFTNAGVYERLSAFEYEQEDETAATTNTKTNHGKYKIEELFYAASNARTGCLYRFSCITINDEMKFTFHPASPIVSEKTNENFAASFLDLLEYIISDDDDSNSNKNDDDKVGASAVKKNDNTDDGIQLPIPENSLVALVALIGSAAVLSHAGAYGQFYSSVMEMKQNIQNPDDFWPALNFWIFFAVGHPILQPILWISDVLHGSPGPMIADLVPATFVLGNVIAIAAFTYVKEIRNAVNVGALFAFFAYVGAGLDGQAGLGDYNLGLDDAYKAPGGGVTVTKIVKGCPAYDDVKQPSMNDFDLKKYQGLWYEQKFHDWTQFKEVYDTTLDIKLTEDGQGWIDDFAVKGPSPNSAKLSWDKSPVANGAHYFLFGRVDPNDPNGILREKGFGVEFPNYIVDVKKDPISGEYTEAIQFQCLERGGVRVFEGINFMSRNPTMTDDELKAMHQRAENAGMYPYGASPEQMHTVERRPIDAPPIDNSWQAMWRGIGVDKLLELLTESIEDGGR